MTVGRWSIIFNKIIRPYVNVNDFHFTSKLAIFTYLDDVPPCKFGEIVFYVEQLFFQQQHLDIICLQETGNGVIKIQIIGEVVVPIICAHIKSSATNT